MRTPHIVPLSRQAIAILKQIQEISGHLELVFPGAQANSPCFLLVCERYLSAGAAAFEVWWGFGCAL
ncbi:hypothetical protein SAMN03159356_00150 [Klebsiella quasipneumoniae]|nr:hypothetical protein SAMN03159441_00144 [Klebsiella quasipneumoniae]SCY54977.1 hypothetical protein SAMN03159308_02062 [Klebsiella quasipneumoniae]SCZ50324.1 hypothetical protein SAMN03159356_00150 [Klebsiella quasipneumoniae]SEK33766.1 hypothetical protein SAMN03159295_00004 [Klebsiella quasipneumoniae]SFJ15824.1 hypothetical protein SAMN03159392_00004 [Klebsiella quasipneumoniae]